MERMWCAFPSIITPQQEPTVRERPGIPYFFRSGLEFYLLHDKGSD